MQSLILSGIPNHACYLSFRMRDGVDTKSMQTCLSDFNYLYDPRSMIVGAGRRVADKLGLAGAELKSFQGIDQAKVSIPNSSFDFWIALYASQRDLLWDVQTQVIEALRETFELAHSVDSFKYREGRDLTGYVDGTENPVDTAAQNAAFNARGDSFVAVQQWRHNFEKIRGLSEKMDQMMGRTLEDDEELEDAPESAHVKRTAQEEFQPEAFILRRSMPWTANGEAGLNFIGFGSSFYAFEAQLRRMSGGEDGVVDALFDFSEPLTTDYYWCPPLLEGKLDWSDF